MNGPDHEETVATATGDPERKTVVGRQSQTKDLPQKLQRLGERFPDLTLEAAEGDLLVIPAAPGTFLELLTYLRDDPEFNLAQLSDLTAVDSLEKGEMTVVYRLVRPVPVYDTVVVKVALPRAAAELPSVTGLWQNADWYEREAWDMFGIRFTGHPYFHRILTWEGFEGHPLRKDFKLPEWRKELESHE